MSTAGTVTVNNREYVLGPGGMLLDLEGKLCGFVGPDIVKASGLADDSENLVELFGRHAVTREPRASGLYVPGRPGRNNAVSVGLVVGMAATAMGSIYGYSALRRMSGVEGAEMEADEAERRANEVGSRLHETRRRHGLE